MAWCEGEGFFKVGMPGYSGIFVSNRNVTVGFFFPKVGKKGTVFQGENAVLTPHGTGLGCQSRFLTFYTLVLFFPLVAIN